MDGFLQRLRRVFWERLARPESRLLLAVSGGRDSMVLLHAMHALTRSFHWELHVAHCHHGLRGREADADADFVRLSASALAVPFIRGDLAVRKRMRDVGESMEMAARELRHRFLAETVLGIGASDVVLAHHADDQAELLLLRLLRGAGSEGLAGMQAIAVSPADRRVRLLRPLLGFGRREIADFAKRAGVRFRHDRSNDDDSIPRNRIRRHLIPLLRKHYSPGLDRVLGRIAEIASAEAEYIRSRAVQWLAAPDKPPFEELHVAVQRAVVREQARPGKDAPDFAAVERRRLDLLGGNPRPPVSRPTRTRTVSATKSTPGSKLKLTARRGVARLGKRVLRWEVRQGPLPFGGDYEQLDLGLTGRDFVLRHRRAGDRFRPLGMTSSGRLQNLFINRCVPAGERASRMLLEIPGGEIAWVEGMPSGEAFRVTAATRRVLVLRRGE